MTSWAFDAKTPPSPPGLIANGLLVVNGDDPELLSAVADFPGKRVTFGFSETNDLFASDVRCNEHGTDFSLNNSRRRVFVPMLGRHSASNALAAIAVGRKLGVPEELIFQGLSEARGPEMRLQLSHSADVSVLNDAYNANPNSMRAAVETLACLPTGGRRVAVLGEMKELGRSSERYHRELGTFAAGFGKLDLLVCVGAGGDWIAEAAVAAGMAPESIQCFSTSDDAAAPVARAIYPGDLVLLKASRSIRLETVAAAIAQRPIATRLAAS